jgi:hypothetical protein
MLEQLRITIENLLQANWYTLNYHGTRLKLPFNPRKNQCACCDRRGLTNIHHWLYRYSRKQVMQNNMLALNYTTEVCFTCHELANSLRKLFTESPNMTIKKPSPIIEKLLELRKTALEKGECFAKLEETDQKTTQECEKVSKNRTKRSKNKKHRADGNSK